MNQKDDDKFITSDSAKILADINLLFKDFDDASELIKSYHDKFNEHRGRSDFLLHSLKDTIYAEFIIKLVSEEFDEVNTLIKKLREKLIMLRRFGLSEIVHIKLKEMDFQINNPFFFTKIRKDYRKIITELKNLDNYAIKNLEIDFDEWASKFERIIERLEDIECDINDEKRSGLYSHITKVAFVGFPILIGVYQLIAMQFFHLDPKIPFIVYLIGMVIIFLILRSGIGIKFLVMDLKKHTFPFIFNILIIPLVLLYLLYASILAKTFINILLISIIFVAYLLYIGSFLIDSISESKKSAIQEELEDLAKDYKVI